MGSATCSKLREVCNDVPTFRKQFKAHPNSGISPDIGYLAGLAKGAETFLNLVESLTMSGDHYSTLRTAVKNFKSTEDILLYPSVAELLIECIDACSGVVKPADSASNNASNATTTNNVSVNATSNATNDSSETKGLDEEDASYWHRLAAVIRQQWSRIIVQPKTTSALVSEIQQCSLNKLPCHGSTGSDASYAVIMMNLFNGKESKVRPDLRAPAFDKVSYNKMVRLTANALSAQLA